MAPDRVLSPVSCPLFPWLPFPGPFAHTINNAYTRENTPKKIVGSALSKSVSPVKSVVGAIRVSYKSTQPFASLQQMANDSRTRRTWTASTHPFIHQSAHPSVPLVL